MNSDIWKMPECMTKKLDGRNPLWLNIHGEIEYDSIFIAIQGLQQKLSRDDALIMVINSGGGEIQAGNLFISYLRMLKIPIFSVASGKVGSMALRIYLEAPKENRFALNGSSFLAHFVSSVPGIPGKVDGFSRISALEKEQAIGVFKIFWDRTIRQNQDTIASIKKAIGDVVRIGEGEDMVEIPTEQFMESDQWIPDDIAQMIGIVDTII